MVAERLERAYGFNPNLMYPGEMMISSQPPPLQPLHRGLPPPPLALPLHHQQQPMSSEERFSGTMSPRGRRQREFIPEAKKDDCYWDRRRRNNEAAKRSREKRRLNDMLLERRVLELTKENWIMKAQIRGVFDNYGIRAEDTLSGVAVDRILASMPSSEQILAFGNRSSSSTRRDSFDMDTPSSGYCDDSLPIKRPKLEMPEQTPTSPEAWSPSHSSLAQKSEDDTWGRETEEEETASRPPTRQETDDWGALNLSSSCSNSSDTGFEPSPMSQSDGHANPFSLSPCSSSLSSSSSSNSPHHLLPHKLRFKHSVDDHLSDENAA